MELIKQSVVIEYITPNALQHIEKAGRTCYKSESKITETSSKEFCERIIKNQHLSVLEHASMTARFITNRGCSHELVRHRLMSVSQESTRYVRYDNIQFILPIWWDDWDDESKAWFSSALQFAEIMYKKLIVSGSRPEKAREVLPNALKTELVCTANFREWMHIIKLRTSKKAHPQIRELILDLESQLKDRLSIF